MPCKFSYETNHQVPWRYESQIVSKNENEVQLLEEKKEETIKKEKTEKKTEAMVTEIGGITRSGRSYKKVGELNEGENQGVTGKDVMDFLKIIKSSEYQVVEQLSRLPAQISILGLLLASEVHRSALLKILKEAHVPTSISPDDLQHLVGQVLATNTVTFTEDELPQEGTGHNKALHVTVRCRENVVARVLVDNGSAINVCPLNTIIKLGLDKSALRPSHLMVRAFDGVKREVLGDIDLSVEVGPHTFEITFQVLDFSSAYNLLLGRAWIHSAGAIPSSLHQKLKYVVNGHLVVLNAEEDLAMSRSPDIPYIDIENDLAPNASHSFEIIHVDYRGEGSISSKPRMSANSMMIGKVMVENGFKPESGLGKGLQGRMNLIDIMEKRDTYGLGYKPTRADKRELAEKKKEERLCRLEGKILMGKRLKAIPPIASSFVKEKKEKALKPLVIKVKPILGKDEVLKKIDNLSEAAIEDTQRQVDDESIPQWMYDSNEEEVAMIQTSSSAPSSKDTIWSASPSERVGNWEIYPLPCDNRG